MEYVTIIVAIALWEYSFFSFKAGFSRNKYGVKAPAISGNIEWEKIYRVQTNTLEQLIIFIPSIYAFAFFVSSLWAMILGSVFLIGRVLYYMGYTTDNPSKRTPGFVMGFLSVQALLMGSFIGALMKLM